jgi:3-deoxy-D-manno-octulosonic acid (KDO) 8-phosphate synthase
MLKTEAFEGVARTTHDMTKLSMKFSGEHQINNHDDGFIIRDAKRKIAAAIGIDALFCEIHPNPDKAFSDGPNSLNFEQAAAVLEKVKLIHDLSRTIQ